MSLYQDHQALEQLTLGKTTFYHDQYDASLLQAVSRSMNREPLEIFPDNLPFHGANIWTLYELSWLNSRGLPQVAVGHATVMCSRKALSLCALYPTRRIRYQSVAHK